MAQLAVLHYGRITAMLTKGFSCLLINQVLYAEKGTIAGVI